MLVWKKLSLETQVKYLIFLLICSVDTSGAAAENTAWSFNNYDNKINALEANQALILRSSSFAEPEKTVL